MIGFYRRKDLKKELVIVLDFGGQYNQLVARRVRECNVYCEIYSYKTDLEKIKAECDDNQEKEIMKEGNILKINFRNEN